MVLALANSSWMGWGTHLPQHPTTSLHPAPRSALFSDPVSPPRSGTHFHSAEIRVQAQPAAAEPLHFLSLWSKNYILLQQPAERRKRRRRRKRLWPSQGRSFLVYKPSFCGGRNKTMPVEL